MLELLFEFIFGIVIEGIFRLFGFLINGLINLVMFLFRRRK